MHGSHRMNEPSIKLSVEDATRRESTRRVDGLGLSPSLVSYDQFMIVIVDQISDFRESLFIR